MKKEFYGANLDKKLFNNLFFAWHLRRFRREAKKIFDKYTNNLKQGGSNETFKL